jgi:zinc transporter ZupT
MVSFAVGGLLGDVFLHLLPHAFAAHGGHDHGGHDHSGGGGGGHVHSLEDLSIGLFVLLGMICFFLLDKFMRYSAGKGGGHSHGHSHGGDAALKKKDDDYDGQGKGKGKGAAEGEGEGGERAWYQQIKPGAWLNMLADTVHNFTDGLAIGATCHTGAGFSTMLAVLFHEIPHEVGDFAILLQQGFTKKQAFSAQFVSATGAFAGCFAGLMMGKVSKRRRGGRIPPVPPVPRRRGRHCHHPCRRRRRLSRHPSRHPSRRHPSRRRLSRRRPTSSTGCGCAMRDTLVSRERELTNLTCCVLCGYGCCSRALVIGKVKREREIPIGCVCGYAVPITR